MEKICSVSIRFATIICYHTPWTVAVGVQTCDLFQKTISSQGYLFRDVNRCFLQSKSVISLPLTPDMIYFSVAELFIEIKHYLSTPDLVWTKNIFSHLKTLCSTWTPGFLWQTVTLFAAPPDFLRVYQQMIKWPLQSPEWSENNVHLSWAGLWARWSLRCWVLWNHTHLVK